MSGVVCLSSLPVACPAYQLLVQLTSCLSSLPVACPAYQLLVQLTSCLSSLPVACPAYQLHCVATVTGVGGGSIDTRQRLSDFPEGAALADLERWVGGSHGRRNCSGAEGNSSCRAGLSGCTPISCAHTVCVRVCVWGGSSACVSNSFSAVLYIANRCNTHGDAQH
jgi:hypothetical protein